MKNQGSCRSEIQVQRLNQKYCPPLNSGSKQIGEKWSKDAIAYECSSVSFWAIMELNVIFLLMWQLKNGKDQVSWYSTWHTCIIEADWRAEEHWQYFSCWKVWGMRKRWTLICWLLIELLNLGVWYMKFLFRYLFYCGKRKHSISYNVDKRRSD